MTKKLKKEMKKWPKKFMTFTMIFAMLFSYFAPITKIFALSNTASLSISFREDNANYGKVQYSLDDGAHWVDVEENIENRNISVSGDNLRLKIVPSENYSVDYTGIEMLQDENKVGGLSTIGFESDNGYAVPSDVQSVQLSQVEFRQNGGGEQGGDTRDYQGNGVSTLNYSIHGAIDYDGGNGYDYGIGFYINNLQYRADESKVQYTEDTMYERDEYGQLIIGDNDEPIPVLDPETMEPLTERTGLTITGDTIHYDYDTDTNKVDFVFTMAPGTLMTGLIINGQEINNLPKTSAELEAVYHDHRLEIAVNGIDKADIYNIEITARYPNSNEEFMGNFLWDYNSQGYTGPDDKILNGSLEFVKAEYDGHVYTTPAEVNALGGVYIWHDAPRKEQYTDEREGCGEAQFPKGTMLTVKIIPDAGYQLVSFGINGGVFEPQEEIGTYSFEVNGGPFHLQAEISETNNAVQANSQNVKSGDIDVNTEFENGTAKLEVNDVASMSPERMEGFENKATDEGYEIENYLDISLYNSIYKGGKKDSNGNYESWDTPVENIDNKATITLKLENDMNGKNLVIVHETHNGNEITGYELIDAVYNEENNTITFETDSFSNYAIASKEITDTTKYTVHFDSNGGTPVEDKEVTAGNSVAEPEQPTNGDKVFDGWFEDETLTTRFDFHTPITRNVTLYAKWIEKEKTEEYTIVDENGNSITFEEEPEREFYFHIIDYLTFTEEDLEEAGIPKEMFDEVKEALKEVTKDYGTLLSFLEIEVQNDDGYLIHEGPFKIKIKMTDEMKKYNTFKIIYVDIENNFDIENPITLTVEGDYLVGTLDHLSTYTITGSYVEEPVNPQTGDLMEVWKNMLLLSILGFTFGTIAVVKTKKSRG